MTGKRDLYQRCRDRRSVQIGHLMPGRQSIVDRCFRSAVKVFDIAGRLAEPRAIGLIRRECFEIVTDAV